MLTEKFNLFKTQFNSASSTFFLHTIPKYNECSQIFDLQKLRSETLAFNSDKQTRSRLFLPVSFNIFLENKKKTKVLSANFCVSTELSSEKHERIAHLLANVLSEQTCLSNSCVNNIQVDKKNWLTTIVFHRGIRWEDKITEKLLSRNKL